MATHHPLSDICLTRMPQLAEVIGSRLMLYPANVTKAKDMREDWTGIKDVETRKKLQNRLNVRAHRK